MFVRMASGKLMPCDPGPDSGGNVAALKSGGRLHAGRIVTAAAPVQEGELQMMAHFVTCDRPSPHRKPRPKTVPVPESEPLF